MSCRYLYRKTIPIPANRLDLSSERAESRIHRHEIDKLVSAKRDGQAQPVAYLRLKNRIEPGLSGGGLVDANGKWIGIASGNSQNQAHYVAPEEIIAFMKAAGLRNQGTVDLLCYGQSRPKPMALAPNTLSFFRLCLLSRSLSLLLFSSAFQDFSVFRTNRVETQRSRGTE